MYLTAWDLAGTTLALAISLTFIITTGVANARLTRSRDQWREDYYALLKAYKNYKLATEAEAQGLPYFWNAEAGTWQYYTAGERD